MILSWINRLINWRLRQIDLDVLWPACKRATHDLDHARAAFAVHALQNEAWMSLGRDEVVRRIDQLK